MRLYNTAVQYTVVLVDREQLPWLDEDSVVTFGDLEILFRLNTS
jgi:hypothetical protein